MISPPSAPLVILTRALLLARSLGEVGRTSRSLSARWPATVTGPGAGTGSKAGRFDREGREPGENGVGLN